VKNRYIACASPEDSLRRRGACLTSEVIHGSEPALGR
jgi:hypothetical protein